MEEANFNFLLILKLLNVFILKEFQTYEKAAKFVWATQHRTEILEKEQENKVNATAVPAGCLGRVSRPHDRQRQPTRSPLITLRWVDGAGRPRRLRLESWRGDSCEQSSRIFSSVLASTCVYEETTWSWGKSHLNALEGTMSGGPMGPD